jgi:dTDP-4-amino-4,6-dideoxygalactose transaminase
MKNIYDLSKKFNFKIIEDASHAFGSIYKNNKIGNCKFSDATVFSFHPVKIITTGEGGAITTNNKILNTRIQSLRTHGIDTNYRKKNKIVKKKPWFFFQTELGLNYRLTDIQASLGISQLKKVDEFVKKRNDISKIYNRKLKNLPLKLPILSNENYSSFHLYVILLKKKNRDDLYKELLKKGYKTNVHYIPIYKHPFYSNKILKKKQFVNNEIYFKNAISLPIFPNLLKKDINKIVNIIKNFLKK